MLVTENGAFEMILIFIVNIWYYDYWMICGDIF